MSGDLRIYSPAEYTEFLAHYPDQKHSITANLLLRPVTDFVSNMSARMLAMGDGREVWPISINNQKHSNPISCSPYTTYVKYPMHMIDKFETLWLKLFVIGGTQLMGLVFKLTQLDKVILINNSLNSVLKHPKLFGQQLPQLTSLLKQVHPDRAILFFRVNSELDKEFMVVLQQQGYVLFPDRLVHLFDPETGFIKQRNVRGDFAILRDTPYQIINHENIVESDIPRIGELYRRLFIDKYSPLNLQYTDEFFRQAINNRWHHYIAFRNSTGQIDAFISWYFNDNTMVCGPLGYDTTVHIEAGLYRMMISSALKFSHENKILFNLGAGSDDFKKKRGSRPVLEYTAVYYRHLSYYRQLPWMMVSRICSVLLPKLFNTNPL